MPTVEPIWILYSLLGLGALILVVRFGKVLVYGLLMIGALGIVMFLADALRQQARATQQTATAATLATTGQTAGTIGQSVLLGLLLLVILCGAGLSGYLYLRLRRTERRPEMYPRQRGPVHEKATWVSGPDAQWQRRPTQPDPGTAIQALVQVELLRTLRELRAPTQRSAPVLPPTEEGYAHEEQDEAVYWGW
jgi:hypothetical protein